MEIIDVTKKSKSEILEKTITVLKNDGLVIFPTETTYGAGVNATSQAAVDTLLAYKTRRQGKPLSIAVSDIRMANQFVDKNQSADRIYTRFLPGPVTVVSKVSSLGESQLASGVVSEFGTLGIRIPDYQLVLDILQQFGKPITATSANSSGKKRPYTVADILDNISNKQRKLIDLVLDAGKLPHNPPSTVIDTTLSTPVTLRTGKEKISPNSHIWNSISSNEQETKSIAGKVLLKHWNKLINQGLIIGLNGPLGAGKTVCAKGVAEFLQINQNITSPTYTYIEEYEYQRHGSSGKLYHLDLWKIDSQERFDLLEIETLPGSNNVLLIEWWNQIQVFAKKKKIWPDVIIEIEDKEQKRNILVQEI